MVNVTFNNVKCTPKDDTKKPWKDQFYYCKVVQGIATGNTNPILPCFINATNGTRHYYTIYDQEEGVNLPQTFKKSS